MISSQTIYENVLNDLFMFLVDGKKYYCYASCLTEYAIYDCTRKSLENSSSTWFPSTSDCAVTKTRYPKMNKDMMKFNKLFTTTISKKF